MTLVRRLLALPPFIFLLLLCDTWAEVLPMMIGGLFITIPYLLAWWLSDGFANVKFGSSDGYHPPISEAYYTYGDDRYGYEMARYLGGGFSPMYGIRRHRHQDW